MNMNMIRHASGISSFCGTSSSGEERFFVFLSSCTSASGTTASSPYCVNVSLYVPSGSAWDKKKLMKRKGMKIRQ